MRLNYLKRTEPPTPNLLLWRLISGRGFYNNIRAFLFLHRPVLIYGYYHAALFIN